MYVFEGKRECSVNASRPATAPFLLQGMSEFAWFRFEKTTNSSFFLLIFLWNLEIWLLSSSLTIVGETWEKTNRETKLVKTIKYNNRWNLHSQYKIVNCKTQIEDLQGFVNRSRGPDMERIEPTWTINIETLEFGKSENRNWSEGVDEEVTVRNLLISFFVMRMWNKC